MFFMELYIKKFVAVNFDKGWPCYQLLGSLPILLLEAINIILAHHYKYHPNDKGGNLYLFERKI